MQGRSFLAVVYAYANHKAHLLRLSLHEKTTVTTDAPSGAKILAATWEPLNEELPAVECTVCTHSFPSRCFPADMCW